MNPTQAATLAYIAKEVADHDMYHNSNGYEFKRFEVEENEYFVMVTTETGLKADENTMASIFARNRRLITIGKRGGLKLLNVKGDIKPTGHSVFYSVTY